MGEAHRASDKAFHSAAFYRFLADHKLMASRCSECGELHVPPRALCPSCHGANMEWAEMSGQGTLVAFTTIHIVPTAMIGAGYGRDNPYCTGIVRLREGPTISAQILGVDAGAPQEIVIGSPAQVAFVRRGEGDDAQTFLAFEIGDSQAD
jgi:uncharacterized OB-fold protein